MATKTTAAFQVDNGANIEYPEHLYDFAGLAEGVATFDDITEEHVARFHEQGYLVVNEAFSADEVQATLAAFADLIAGKNPDFNGIMFEQAANDLDLDALSVEEKQDYIRKFMWFVDYDQRLKDFSEHPRLRATLKRLMNDDPVMFQDMALLKPPRFGREKPWHQDMAYFNVATDTVVVGCWIALDEATPDNGCMVINPGTHRDGPVVHFKRRDWQICDTDVRNQGALAVPLKPGGCLLFHGLLQHGTPTNRSGQRRRAVQFHYRPAGTVVTSLEDRLAVYGSEGKDVTC